MSLIKQECALIWRELKTPAPYALALAGGFMAYARLGFLPISLGTLTVLAFVLALASMVDVRTRLLPHSLNCLLISTGLFISTPLLGSPLVNAFVGAFLAWGGLLGLGLLMQKITKKQAIGGGDVWLVGGIGAWIGLSGLPFFLLLVAVLGVITIIWRRLAGHKAPRFAFGPILAAAGFLALLYQEYYWQCILSFTA